MEDREVNVCSCCDYGDWWAFEIGITFDIVEPVDENENRVDSEEVAQDE